MSPKLIYYQNRSVNKSNNVLKFKIKIKIKFQEIGPDYLGLVFKGTWYMDIFIATSSTVFTNIGSTSFIFLIIRVQLNVKTLVVQAVLGP